MSYEIPQSLQYQEKIIFNLTFEQLIYVIISGLLAFFIYAKTGFSLEIRIGLAIIPLIIALPFMYFNGLSRILEIISWLRFREAENTQEKMKKFLGVTAIEKDCYHIAHKKTEKKVAVLVVEPLNFKIKKKDAQKSIIHSFQKFLNALDFPVQLLMYSDSLNLDKYLEEVEEKVKNINQDIYTELFKGHKQHIKEIITQNAYSNRRFLIAVQENDMGLQTQVKIIIDLLYGLKLKCKRLKGHQLIILLSRFFRNELKNQDPYFRIVPKHIKNFPDYIQVNNSFMRTIAAVGYPRIVEQGFLDKIITAPGDFDLAVHIEPFPTDTTLVMLNKELQKQQADLYAAQLKGQFSPSLEIQYTDTKGVLNSIQKGQEKLFHVSLYVNIRAKTVNELNMLAKSIESKLNSILVIPKTHKFQMHKGLQSILPFASNKLGIRRNITTQALSAFFPFTSPFLQLEKGGVFLGLNRNNLPIIKDIFSLSNANGAILATSGGGKSYTAKLIISRYLMNDTKVMVIDPQNEYGDLTKEYGGSLINISRKSDTIINPLDLLGHSYADKRLSLIDLFKIMFGDLSEIQKAVLDKALSKTYDRKGITMNYYRNKVPPILSDLERELEKMSKDASVYERTTYTALLNRLGMYTTGVFAFLNKQTKIDVDNNFITFNIGHMPKQVKPAMMFLILDYVYSKMKRDKSKKLLVIDEAWSMLQNAGEEGYIFEVVKTCRKFNLGLLLITQDVADLVNSKAGRAVLANSSYTILLRQKPAVINSVKEVFHLSETEKEHLLTARVGEGLLLMENDHQELKIVASTSEHKLITTNPNEEIEIEDDSEQEEFNINLDLTKGFYQKNLLKKEEVEYLLKNGYEESKHVSLDSKNYSIYLIKKIGLHKPEHTFLLHDIYLELLKYTKEATPDESSRMDSLNPDIIFTDAKGATWAVEVETGNNFRHHRKYLQQKVENLDKKYPHRWLFVLTTNRFKESYGRAFKAPILLRNEVSEFIKQQFEDKSGV